MTMSLLENFDNDCEMTVLPQPNAPGTAHVPPCTHLKHKAHLHHTRHPCTHLDHTRHAYHTLITHPPATQITPLSRLSHISYLHHTNHTCHIDHTIITYLPYKSHLHHTCHTYHTLHTPATQITPRMSHKSRPTPTTPCTLSMFLREECIEDTQSSQERIVSGKFLSDWSQLTDRPDLHQCVLGPLSIELRLQHCLLATTTNTTLSPTPSLINHNKHNFTSNTVS